LKRSGSIFDFRNHRLYLIAAPHFGKLGELWNYYKVGVINAAFGYGLYSALIFIHLNVFLAQLLSHITGMSFNYFMFRQHVFRNADPAILRYIGAYTVNYFFGLAFLALFHRLFPSPYVAGFLALLAVSMVNYVILKLFVFRRSMVRP
jgi:putative flippase GtrA